MRQERRLNLVPSAMLKHILGVKWHYNITNIEILSLVSPSCTPYSVRSTWDGSEFVAWMSWTHPQGIMTDNRSQESRTPPTLWFMDACKCDLKVCEINPNNWEDAESYRNRWRRTVKERIEKPKQTWNVTRKLKRSTLVAKTTLLFPTPQIHLRRVQEAVALAHWPAQLHKHHHWLTRAHNVCPSRPRLHDNSANAFAILLENSLSTTVFSTNVLKAVNNADTVVMFT